MLKENIKNCATIFFLLFIGYFIINIFPFIISSYNSRENILSNLDAANTYIGEKRETISKNTSKNIQDHISDKTSLSTDRLRNNLLKKANEYQESSKHIRSFIKKITGIDLKKVAEDFLGNK